MVKILIKIYLLNFFTQKFIVKICLIILWITLLKKSIVKTFLIILINNFFFKILFIKVIILLILNFHIPRQDKQEFHQLLHLVLFQITDLNNLMIYSFLRE